MMEQNDCTEFNQRTQCKSNDKRAIELEPTAAEAAGTYRVLLNLIFILIICLQLCIFLVLYFFFLRNTIHTEFSIFHK